MGQISGPESEEAVSMCDGDFLGMKPIHEGASDCVFAARSKLDGSLCVVKKFELYDESKFLKGWSDRAHSDEQRGRSWS